MHPEPIPFCFMAEKEKALISVIIPCYNQAVYLPEALESLLKQTYTHWEAIVVNDGSPDDTEAVALEYARQFPQIKYVSQSNGGLSAARNKGIEYAQGTYILPLDADDRISPKYMEEAMRAFEEKPVETGVLSGILFRCQNRPMGRLAV